MRRHQYAVGAASVAFWVLVVSCSDTGGNGGAGGASGNSGSGARSGASGADNGASAGAFDAGAGSGALGGSSFAGEPAGGDGGFSGAGPRPPAADGASGSAGESAAAGAAGQPQVSHAHCVAKADAPCMSTATDCSTGLLCSAGTCVAGPVAGQSALGPNHDQCAHGFYANAGTGGLCVARAPAGTIHCAYEGDDSSPWPHCVEEFACVFLAVSLDTTECAGSLQQAQLCSQDSQCAPGLDCVGLENGSDARCWPHVPVGGLCGPGALMAGKCVTGSYCQPGNVDLGTFAKCVAYPGIGQACASGNCGPGLLCHAGQCVALATLGSACDQIACAPNLVCVNDSAG